MAGLNSVRTSKKRCETSLMCSKAELNFTSRDLLSQTRKFFHIHRFIKGRGFMEILKLVPLLLAASILLLAELTGNGFSGT